MRADRLLELLLRLQMRGGAPASELARALEVSVRTVYRDVEALSAAGVPVWTETGRGGGIRIDPTYRVGGLPRLDTAEARSLMFAAVPAIAARLGLDDVAERSLLPALERSSEGAARVVRDRLLVEPEHWFDDAGESPHLASLAQAVWGSRALRLVYRGDRLVVHPLGLVLRGSTWYLVGRCRPDDGRGTRLFRVSRVEEATVLDQVLTPPVDFDLTSTWRALREEFRAGLPRFEVTVRVAPDAEPLLGALEEASPSLPLPADVRRDGEGWALLDLVFERGPAGAARKLLQLGGGVEVLRPASVRALLIQESQRLASLYVAAPVTTWSHGNGDSDVTAPAVRPATAGDWPAIWRIVQDVAAEGTTFAMDPAPAEADARRSWMTAAPGRVVVAVDVDGTVLGTANAYANRPHQGGHVASGSFIVSAEARGRGVGRVLVRDMLDWTRAAGFAAVQFNAVVATNEAAIALYDSEGFRTIGVAPGAFRHPTAGDVDLLIMWRDLI